MDVAQSHFSTLPQKIFGDQIIEVKDQVSQDLRLRFAQYLTPSAAYRAFERETGMSKRQAERYLAGESTPQFLNLKKIYTFITKEQNYEQLLALVPKNIAHELQSKNTSSSLDSKIKLDVDLSGEIAGCRAFSYIYWNTVQGLRLSRREVEKKYGEYGLRTLSRMEKRGIIKCEAKEYFISGNCRSTPINAEASAATARDLIENHFSPQAAGWEGQNYLGFQVFTLNKQAKEIALFKMEKLHRDLKELANASSGEEEPFFIVLCADKMRPTEEN